MAVKEARSCQKADINSSAIQIVADAANQAVTGWRRTTLKPHPIMMIATANVTRPSQRAWTSILIRRWSVLSITSVIFLLLLGQPRALDRSSRPAP
jgi:hypothetical protein